ncbi:hypothetical protein ACR6HW_06525 [Fusibacter sp. JL298sf-3]
MKKAILLLIGSIPFFLGSFINVLATDIFYEHVLPYKGIGIAFLIAWFFVGRFSNKLVENKKSAFLIGNAMAFAVLLLLLYQVVILGHYWSNVVGVATQFYYLPLVGLMALFARISTALVYGVSFLAMCAVFYCGAHKASDS